jgi:aminopeptidase N
MKPLTILLFAALLLARASAQPIDSTISGPLSYAPQPFDVLHYDAEIDLTKVPSRDISGVVDIVVRWSAGDEQQAYFAFHLRSLTIDGAWYEGEPIAVTTIGDSTSATYHHRIVPPVRPAEGDTATIRIAYHGRMTDELGPGTWGGVGTGDSTVFAMGVGFLNNYVSTTQHWLPCYDHPSDKATFHARFKTLGRFVTASNGLLSQSTSGDTTIDEWTTTIPTATYLLTFAVGRYVPLSFGADPVPMVVYSQPKDSAPTRNAFRALPHMVRTFSERFIPYPFEKVGYVNTPIGAMEHQTMISYPTSLSRRSDTVNFIAAHELAHQWFGDLVTPRDFRHVWLTESFATFCETLWAEELGGSSGYLSAQASMRNRYLSSIAPAEGILPLYDFPRAQPSSNYPETIYQKGAVVLGMLRYEMGDTAFFAALREYLTTYAYSTATTDELRSVLERHHGSSLGWFFDQWVYAKGWPELRVWQTSEPAGELRRVTVRIDQTSTGDARVYHRLAVPLHFYGTIDTTGSATRVVMLDSASQTFVLDSIPPYQSMRVNDDGPVRSLLRVAIQSGIEASAPDSGDVSFFVKPNPSDGTAALIVQVRGVSDCSGVHYELYDSSGRRLGTGSSDLCEFTIPTDGIASGAYVLRFRFREQFHDVSIVIAR